MPTNQTALYEQTDGPTGTEPSLADLKAHLRITNTAEDSALTQFLAAAIEVVERRTGRLIRAGTFTGEFPVLEESPKERGPYIELERSPISVLTSIEVWDGSAYAAVAQPGNYFTKKVNGGYWRVVFTDPTSLFTADFSEVPYIVKATFDAGYGDGNIPAGLSQAVLNYAGWLYGNRGDCSEGDMPAAVADQLKLWKVRRDFG